MTSLSILILFVLANIALTQWGPPFDGGWVPPGAPGPYLENGWNGPGGGRNSWGDDGGSWDSDSGPPNGNRGGWNSNRGGRRGGNRGGWNSNQGRGRGGNHGNWESNREEGGRGGNRGGWDSNREEGRGGNRGDWDSNQEGGPSGSRGDWNSNREEGGRGGNRGGWDPNREEGRGGNRGDWDSNQEGGPSGSRGDWNSNRGGGRGGNRGNWKDGGRRGGNRGGSWEGHRTGAFGTTAAATSTVVATTTAAGPKTSTVSPDQTRLCSNNGHISNDEVRNIFLDHHNEHRSQLARGLVNNGNPKVHARQASKMIKLEYDCDAEKTAYEWAMQCEDRDSGRSGVSENRYTFPNTNLDMATVARRASNRWWEEITNVGLSQTNNRFYTNLGISHWAKMAWDSTRYFGCGIYKCPNFINAVCHYKGGGIVGTQIYKMGPACNRCHLINAKQCEQGLCVL